MRIAKADSELEDQTFFEEIIKRSVPKYQKLKNFTSLASKAGDTRSLQGCRFSPDAQSSLLLTSSWSGNCKLWNIPSCQEIANSQSFCHAVSWHPLACIQQQVNELSFASAYANGRVGLFSLSRDTPLCLFQAHTQRIGAVEFHPHLHNLLFTCGYDYFWKMWDVEYSQKSQQSQSSSSQQEQSNTIKDPTYVIMQEGHDGCVHTMDLHTDGSILATGGLDSHIFLWDLRSGKRIAVFSGHQQIQPSPLTLNSHLLVSGGGDNAIRIWDLRVRRTIDTVLAHSALVSAVRHEPNFGDFLISVSHDRTIKIWNAHSFTCIKTLTTHGDIIFGADIGRNNRYIASCSNDRTWKLWGHQSEAFSEDFLKSASLINNINAKEDQFGYDDDEDDEEGIDKEDDKMKLNVLRRLKQENEAEKDIDEDEQKKNRLDQMKKDINSDDDSNASSEEEQEDDWNKTSSKSRMKKDK
ncbi:MAG: putative U4/U6 small nuclear ribonucleoprotein Prp4 [Streblomastix strix]|uniref:Putative U4/U6 small nuclear ribonucleoprotein Prp4 n=1 Tax=Streblomastix strix TaxID=222440 RepID=A0A5J4X0H8_9EUKA|nr:MAG: putative U4/U6 small nuclear ribonucleoprotein Prp4 [Streblomastix strix]